MLVTGGCGGDAHIAHRTHHPRGKLFIAITVAEHPMITSTEGVQGTLLGHDEAVITASRRAVRPDAH